MNNAKFSKKKFVFIAGIVLLVVLAAAPSVYFYQQYMNTKRQMSAQGVVSKEETKALTTSIGKLIELPTDEEPTIALVSDVTKLKDQPFFVNAKNGDRVLIYVKARKAILYRPSINKIIEVAPVNLPPQETTPTPTVKGTTTTAPTPKPTVKPTDTPATSAAEAK